MKVKWNGGVYDLELDPSQPLDVFKNQIFSVTNVHPSRQKVLKSGVQVKETTDLSKFKQGQVLMMLGSVGELLKEPVEKTLFLEDMTDSEVAQAVRTAS